MKRVILSIDDSNMAGDSWTHTFWLTMARDGTFTLDVQQSAIEGECLDISPASGMATGVDIYRALTAALDELGYEFNVVDLDAVADEIAALSPNVAEQFRTAPAAIEEMDDADEQAAAANRYEALAPFSAAIESYVARFSDDKLYYPGAGYVYPSRRHWVRRFMEDYVVAHGSLPRGKHRIEVTGYSGGEHDFADE